jgi:hypothetical protein
VAAPSIHCYEIATGTAETVVISKPGSGSTAGPDGAKDPAAGDYLVAVLANDSTSAAGALAWFAPDGTWTQISSGDIGDGTSDAHCTAYIRKLDGTEGANFTFSSDELIGIVGCLILLSGVHQTQASALHAPAGNDVIDGTPPIAITGFTTGVADVLALAIWTYDGADDGGYAVSGTGWAELLEMRRGTSQANESGGVAYRKMTTSGQATGTCTVTPTVSDGMAGAQFGIVPGAAATNAPAGLASGTGQAFDIVPVAVWPIPQLAMPPMVPA